MSHVYYFFAIFAILFEMMVLSNPKRYHAFALSFKNKKQSEYTPRQNTLAVMMFLYILWVLGGLFTFQWTLFLFFIVISFIPKRWIWLRAIDAAISFATLVFILLNKYHFHINIAEILK